MSDKRDDIDVAAMGKAMYEDIREDLEATHN
jgi:hypothetical protein